MESDNRKENSPRFCPYGVYNSLVDFFFSPLSEGLEQLLIELYEQFQRDQIVSKTS